MAFDKVGFERLWTHIIARLGNKVDKIEGKGLSTCDFTPSEKEKLSILKEHKQADWENTIPEDEAFIVNKPVTLENRTVIDYRGVPIDDKTYEMGFSWGPEYYYKISDLVINNTNFFIGAKLAMQDADGNIYQIEDFPIDQLNDNNGIIQYNTAMFFVYVAWEDWTPGIYSHISNPMFRILAPTEVIREDAITDEIARKKDIIIPVQSDWNTKDENDLSYIKNRPFGEVPRVITWDGNTDGLENITIPAGFIGENSKETVAYLIYNPENMNDLNPNNFEGKEISAILNGTINKYIMSQNPPTDTTGYVTITQAPYYVYVIFNPDDNNTDWPATQGLVLFVCGADNYTWNGLTFPYKGIYSVVEEGREFPISIGMTDGIKPIDDQYIPDNIARKDDIIEPAPNWGAHDGNSLSYNYIKSRTHYDYYVGGSNGFVVDATIMESHYTNKLPSKYTAKEGELVLNRELVVGKEYVVRLDGSISIVECKMHPTLNVPYLGNYKRYATQVGESTDVEDTGEPIYFIGTTLYRLDYCRRDIVLVIYEVEDHEVFQLHDRFIPESVARKKDIVTPVQSDWNTNDETDLSYVKNKTHWEEEKKEVILDRTVDLTSAESDDNGVFFFGFEENAFQIEHDVKYIVNWNGVEYICKGIHCIKQFFNGEYHYYDYIGNVALAPIYYNYKYENISSNEPFYIGYEHQFERGDYWVLGTKENSIHHITITKITNEIHTIDNKYLDIEYNDIKNTLVYEKNNYKKIFDYHDFMIGSSSSGPDQNGEYYSFGYELDTVNTPRLPIMKMGTEYLVEYPGKQEILSPININNDEYPEPNLFVGVEGEDLSTAKIRFGFSWYTRYEWLYLLKSYCEDPNFYFRVYEPTYDLKQLDEKFIPNTIARVNSIPTYALPSICLSDSSTGALYNLSVRDGELIITAVETV